MKKAMNVQRPRPPKRHSEEVIKFNSEFQILIYYLRFLEDQIKRKRSRTTLSLARKKEVVNHLPLLIVRLVDGALVVVVVVVLVVP